MNRPVRKNMIRVPMTDEESEVAKEKAEFLGIPVARLIRRCVFGVEYEVQRQIDPAGTVKPSICLPGCEITILPER